MASPQQLLSAQYALDFNAFNNLEYVPSTVDSFGNPVSTTYNITLDSSNNPVITFTQSEAIIGSSGIVLPSPIPLFSVASSDVSYNVIPVVTSFQIYKYAIPQGNSTQNNANQAKYTNTNVYNTLSQTYSSTLASSAPFFNYKTTLASYDYLSPAPTYGYQGNSKYAVVKVTFYKATDPNLQIWTPLSVDNQIIA